MHSYFLAIRTHQSIVKVLKDLHCSCVDFQLTSFQGEEKHTVSSFKLAGLPTAATETLNILDPCECPWVSFGNSAICKPTEPDKEEDLMANQEQVISGCLG